MSESSSTHPPPSQSMPNHLTITQILLLLSLPFFLLLLLLSSSLHYLFPEPSQQPPKLSPCHPNSSLHCYQSWHSRTSTNPLNMLSPFYPCPALKSYEKTNRFSYYILSMPLLLPSPLLSLHLCLQNTHYPLSLCSDSTSTKSFQSLPAIRHHPPVVFCVLIIVFFTVSRVHYVVTAWRVLTLPYLYVCSKTQHCASYITHAQ